METALIILGCLLLLAGLFICAVNVYIALRCIRTQQFTSMVPLIGSLFLILGLGLLGNRLGDGSGDALALVLPFLMLDLSGLPSLLCLPLLGLRRILHHLLPAEVKILLLFLYLLLASVVALQTALCHFTGGLPTPS